MKVIYSRDDKGNKGIAIIECNLAVAMGTTNDANNITVENGEYRIRIPMPSYEVAVKVLSLAITKMELDGTDILHLEDFESYLNT